MGRSEIDWRYGHAQFCQKVKVLYGLAWESQEKKKTLSGGRPTLNLRVAHCSQRSFTRHHHRSAMVWMDDSLKGCKMSSCMK